MKRSIEIAKKGNLVCTNCLNWVKWLGWEWSDWKMFQALFEYMLEEWQVRGHIAEVLKFWVFLASSWSALFIVSGGEGLEVEYIPEGERCWNFMYSYFFALLSLTLWRCWMGRLICPWANWTCLLVLSRFNQEWCPEGRCCCLWGEGTQEPVILWPSNWRVMFDEVIRRLVFQKNETNSCTWVWCYSYWSQAAEI